MRKLLIAAVLAVLPTCAFAQAGVQLGAGQVFGNSSAARAPGKAESVTAILDRALGSTRGAILERGASGWGIIGPSATAGLPFINGGTGADGAYGVLGVVGGGTGNASYAIGDILYASTTSVLSRLADVAAGNALISGGAGVAPAWGKITSSHLNITTTSCTNQFLTAISAAAGGTCATVTLASAQFANQGTTTTVLHGNAAGNPSFGAVSMSADVTGTLGVGNGGTGGSAASGTLLDNITGFSSTGYMRRTGAGAYAFSSPASGAQYLAGTATNVPIEPSIIYQAEVSLGNSGAGTQTFDFSTFINASTTMTGAITTQTLSNVTAGKAGTITYIQDGTGSRTTVWNAIFKWQSGTAPVLSTAAAAVDVLSYSCRSATFCAASLMKDVR